MDFFSIVVGVYLDKYFYHIIIVIQAEEMLNIMENLNKNILFLEVGHGA